MVQVHDSILPNFCMFENALNEKGFLKKTFVEKH